MEEQIQPGDAPWPRIDVTTVDVSIKAMFTQEMYDTISRSSNPAAQYISKFARERNYQWDELAACAWLDPTMLEYSLFSKMIT